VVYQMELLSWRKARVVIAPNQEAGEIDFIIFGSVSWIVICVWALLMYFSD